MMRTEISPLLAAIIFLKGDFVGGLYVVKDFDGKKHRFPPKNVLPTVRLKFNKVIFPLKLYVVVLACYVRVSERSSIARMIDR
mmetsp:Transcript_18586/g.27446  ORF Transcript_18586/g.27446 Transcript_18586/m.27446 type:complete len:83 (-) Transcript_18586:3-251(-)